MGESTLWWYAVQRAQSEHSFSPVCPITKNFLITLGAAVSRFYKARGARPARFGKMVCFLVGPMTKIVFLNGSSRSNVLAPQGSFFGVRSTSTFWFHSSK